MPRTSALFVAAALATACGGKKDAAKHDDAGSGSGSAALAPLAMPALGVDQIARMGFVWAEGSPAYAKALSAYKAKPRDWAGVRASCEAAIAKDPSHLDAHRLLASALAQTGDNAAAVDHLVTALAGDYYAYAPNLAKDPDLAQLLATNHGQALLALAAKLHDEYGKRVASGLWLVGRRSPFRWPASAGVQPGTSRGELYAYDLAAKRYLRLTHTDHQVAGFARAGGAEVAVLGFDKVDHPKGDAAPLVARGWIQALDAAEWTPLSPRVNLSPAREIAVGYGAGDQLLVALSPADGRWGLGAPVVSSVDRGAGKLVKTAAGAPSTRVAFTLDEGRVVRSPDDAQITATWAGEPPSAPSLKTAAGAQIAVPESGAAAASSVSVSPGGAHVAFATAVDPCAKDAAPSLYVADGKTGALKHVLTARSRFSTRWLDGSTLAYEDGDGAIRLWDATTGRESQRLDNKAGLALDVLSLAPAPLCKQAPPTAEPAGSATDEPLPQEEGSAAPVTHPE